MVGIVEAEEFNLEPSPRVLAMLGEISLDQWRCLAELVDNAVDGFLHAHRSGFPVTAPEVRVTLPSAGGPNAGVRVRDNGPGMTPDLLEQAVRAGWTGNNPIDSLGLFGMGFNIATARLGTVTEVRSTRAGDPEWHGLVIDFDQFRRQGHFRTRHLVTPKADPGVHGTEVVIRNLKAEQVDWFIKPHNLSKVRTQLSQSYSAMLRENGEPIHFKLYVNDRLVAARSHCVWDDARGWESPDLGRVSAVQTIDRMLPPKRFCTHCMRWLGADETSCTTELCQIVERPRRVRGWIGVQRYLHETEFGIDFIRNGRKIEIGNKDLFTWINEDGGQELEYPIDDPRNRGRFVGEIHIDHCRVNYSKDRFDRADPAWSDMVHLVRGEGPLRPERAKELRYGSNASPLYRLFKAFRRSTIKNKQGTGYCRLLLVADNDQARDWAQRFYAGDAEFQSDSKWWELASADDNRNLRFSGGPTVSGGPTGGPPPDDFVDPPEEHPSGAPSGPQPPPLSPAPTPLPSPLPARTRLADLSRKYEQARPSPDFTVEAFATSPDDPELGENAWILRMMVTSSRTYGFLVNLRHPVFQSASFTPRDALLSEIAILTMEFMRDLPGAMPHARLLAGLRQRFATDDDIDPQRLAQTARDALTAIVRAAAAGLDAGDGRDGAALFAEFGAEEQTALLRAMAARGGVLNPSALIAGGQFLELLSPDQIRDFFLRHPELFLDGRYWSDPYSEIDFGDGATTDFARSNVVERYAGLLADAVWLIRQNATMLAELPRDELVRAALSIRLLGPDVEAD